MQVLYSSKSSGVHYSSNKKTLQSLVSGLDETNFDDRVRLFLKEEKEKIVKYRSELTPGEPYLVPHHYKGDNTPVFSFSLWVITLRNEKEPMYWSSYDWQHAGCTSPEEVCLIYVEPFVVLNDITSDISRITGKLAACSYAKVLFNGNVVYVDYSTLFMPLKKRPTPR